MYRKTSWLLAVLVVTSSYGVVWAQEKTTQPTTAPDEFKPLVATVKEVKGTAQYLRAGEGEKWQPVKVGDKLDELTVIRTGFRTRVVLTFEDNSEVVIDRATKMGISQFRKVGKVTRTKIGLKYGSMRMNVSKARGPSDFTVATPVATLAVRGSSSKTGFSDFGLGLNVGSGDWNVLMGAKGRTFGKGETTDGKLTLAIEKTKLLTAVLLGDVYGGLSKREILSLLNNGGGRGSIGLVGAGVGSQTTIIKPVDVDVPGLDIDIGM